MVRTARWVRHPLTADSSAHASWGGRRRRRPRAPPPARARSDAARGRRARGWLAAALLAVTGAWPVARSAAHGVAAGGSDPGARRAGHRPTAVGTDRWRRRPARPRPPRPRRCPALAPFRAAPVLPHDVRRRARLPGRAPGPRLRRLLRRRFGARPPRLHVRGRRRTLCGTAVHPHRVPGPVRLHERGPQQLGPHRHRIRPRPLRSGISVRTGRLRAPPLSTSRVGRRE